MRRKEITAAELVSKLEQDPEYVARRAAQEAAWEIEDQEHREAERDLTQDLSKAGISVESVWDLVNTSHPYPAALPVLVSHLQKGRYSDKIMEGIARALAVPSAVAWWDQLKAIYLTTDSERERESLAVTLSGAADKAHLEDLYSFASDPSLVAGVSCSWNRSNVWVVDGQLNS